MALKGDTHSYEVTTKSGEKVTRTITKGSGKSRTINDSDGTKRTDYGGGFRTSINSEGQTTLDTTGVREAAAKEKERIQDQVKSPQAASNKDYNSQSNMSAENPEVLQKILANQSQEKNVSTEKPSVLKKYSQPPTTPPSMISAEKKPKGINRLTYSINKTADKLKQKLDKDQDTGKSLIGVGALYLGAKVVQGAGNTAAFIITSPVLAYELNPAKNLVSYSIDVKNLGFKGAATKQRNKNIAVGVASANLAVQSLKDPIGSTAELAGGALVFKGMSIGTKALRNGVTSNVVVENGQTTVNLARNKAGGYEYRSRWQRVKDTVNNNDFVKFNRDLFADETARLRPRGRSTSRGRGEKITARRGGDININGRTFRAYTERTGRYNPLAKGDKNNFVREINKAPQQFKKGVYDGVTITKAPYKPSPKQVVNAQSTNVVNMNNQKALQRVSQETNLLNGKNVNKLRNRPIVEPKKTPAYTYNVNTQKVQSQQGQAVLITKNKPPLRIVNDAFKTPETKVKVSSGGRVKVKVNDELTLRRKDYELTLRKKGSVDKGQVTKKDNSIIYQYSEERALVTVPNQAAKEIVITKNVNKAVSRTGSFDKRNILKFQEVMGGVPKNNYYYVPPPNYGSSSSSRDDTQAFKSSIDSTSNSKKESFGAARTIYEKPVNVVKPVVASKIINKNIKVGALNNNLDIGLASDVSTRTASESLYDTVTAQSTSTDTEQRLTNEQAIEQITTPVSFTGGGGDTTNILNPNIPPRTGIVSQPNKGGNPRRPPTNIINKIPPFIPTFKAELPTFTSKGQFLGQVRKGERFQTVSVGGLSQVTKDAINIVATSPLATVKIINVNTGEAVTNKALMGSRFRPSKTWAGAFVEKNKFRIDTSGEVAGISLKGGKKSKRGLGKWSIFQV